jgi:dTDP-glucose 4,6-dehydratase
MTNNSMRVLITGGAGFVGSHLCHALVAGGHSVVCADNLLTGRIENLVHLTCESRFEFMRQDVCRPFDPGKIDYLFHFASPASPIDYQKHGIETLQVGSAGTINCLELAKRYNAKFLLASTSECYGDPLEHPQKESYWGHVNPIGPRSVYDESKRFAEAATMAYHRYRHVDTRIVRIFNTYGPRLQIDDGRVISNFMKQALRGEPLTVYGDGLQTRSFCYVSDEIEGILALSRVQESLPTNIGNPREFTVLECAQLVLQVTGSKSAVHFEPLPQDDPRQRCPDITKARTLLGWEPKIDLLTGLQLSLDYFRAAVRPQSQMTNVDISTQDEHGCQSHRLQVGIGEPGSAPQAK